MGADQGSAGEGVSQGEVCSGTEFVKLLDDRSEQVIDFRPVLSGELFGPLRDPALFCQVRLDPEVLTLVWPNGADFDPATLHDWPDQVKALQAMARRWEAGAA